MRGSVFTSKIRLDAVTSQQFNLLVILGSVLGCQLLSNTVISLGVTETVITPCYCDYCDYCYFFK